MKVLLLPTLMALQLMAGTWAYPSGAPVGTCESMQPNTAAAPTGHGAEAQTSDSPYTLDVSESSVSAGEKVTVTVKGSDAFKGILLQARKSGETSALGSFSDIPNGYKGLGCASGTDTAVTHDSNDDKNAPQEFSWTAPSDLDGDVEFVATIVQAKATYWMNVKSASVEVTSGSGPSQSPLMLGFILTLSLLLVLF